MHPVHFFHFCCEGEGHVQTLYDGQWNLLPICCCSVQAQEQFIKSIKWISSKKRNVWACKWFHSACNLPIFTNMFTNFWLTQCSFLWSTSLWSVFLDVQFCCGQWIVHHKGAAWKQISCFSQLRYYHYCTSISFGLLLLPQSIAETLWGLFELGLRLNHLQLSIWCTAFTCCRTVLPCCRTLPQIMLFGIALFFAGL